MLIYNRKTRQEARRNNFYIAYSMTLLILMTFAFATNAVMGQLMWINHRDYEGGPLAYYAASANSWFETLGTSMDVVANIMADALLVYRCYVIWRRSIWVLIPLLLLYMASVAFSLLTTMQSALPNNHILANSTNFFIPWISLTSGLNFIVTGLIVYRILAFSRRARGTLPDEAHKVYTGAASILVESALPFSILGIIFAVYTSKGQAPQVALGFIWGTFFALSPQLIILRVAMGRAWSSNTEDKITTSSIAFKPSMVQFDRDRSETAFHENSRPADEPAKDISEKGSSSSNV
ncbi:hypothetical protein JR316_0002780 [Psilocybe cubensis]|uniref:Uncharacterized protein n=2 Tax=Psilocybe cubensis TaxID=181762 RepID=A0ACB8HDR2_PSICU|nr:hypothetical protein JR316_0002780 [Psilocybe cubensis]KAH9485865.1 hypothetical protein JR316_0002780 [Psilocybe cubensis]